MIDQFYRTSSGQGGFFGASTNIPVYGFNIKRDNSSEGKSLSEEDNEEDEEEEKAPQFGKHLNDSFWTKLYNFNITFNGFN